MNKYQEILLNRIKFTTNEKGSSFSLNGDTAIVHQPENAYIDNLEIKAACSTLKCIIVDGIEYESCGGEIKFFISFENDSKTLTFRFNNEVVDDCVFTIVLFKTSKEEWDKKVEREKKERMIKEVDLAVTTGISLINVIFTLIDGAKYAVAELFVGYRKIGEFRNRDNQSYISITGLAFGDYGVVLSLYDKDDNLIIKTNSAAVCLLSYVPELKIIEEKLDSVIRCVKPHHC